MSAGEVLLTLLVALLVFGPSKLPMLAHHLAKMARLLHHYQQQWSRFWQSQLNEHQLQENLKKAKKADTKYLQDEEVP
ncbi:twin-arginine translocase TatA/TatE family subunit [Legionella oakridgensis]|uniref:Sec-independent protein secretion pathway component n=2 Tax=Legionella oakridgensis TaxID=29423 RepID=W0BIC9_9GAMM|nr:twin-arginine translocase TatA/TatE family subunit [Legionella oakridgensis]AHE68362.1 Sec-independent protein secretion pathway component [Legionella oakridgensis ATCC 33761 = DSM 21215]ETO92171.1 Sec-independent protein secretion pathway component [Legionella oakridgensis RV-2-2007]KTD38968.1 TatB protein (twin arginine translocation) [Legionella oakridgensis]STY21304.1 sec-independent protein translocase protein TatB [Legionella longbeachae]